MQDRATYFADITDGLEDSVHPGWAEQAFQKFNEIGMNDSLATYLAAFLVTQGDPDASSNLLEYLINEYPTFKLVDQWKGQDA